MRDPSTAATGTISRKTSFKIFLRVPSTVKLSEILSLRFDAQLTLLNFLLFHRINARAENLLQRINNLLRIKKKYNVVGSMIFLIFTVYCLYVGVGSKYSYTWN